MNAELGRLDQIQRFYFNLLHRVEI
ncbi:hypothetical protein J2R98_001784 [Alkalibacillus filiformis]|uniref:Uncharacterized protein n=1 Tax=Alkalibacillus filiformis TaxID=200990 RepID=A0ABU0DU07_9BACI|nr:hypothetical protein [Alkalibacillus filiformis]